MLSSKKKKTHFLYLRSQDRVVGTISWLNSSVTEYTSWLTQRLDGAARMTALEDWAFQSLTSQHNEVKRLVDIPRFCRKIPPLHFLELIPSARKMKPRWLLWALASFIVVPGFRTGKLRVPSESWDRHYFPQTQNQRGSLSVLSSTFCDHPWSPISLFLPQGSPVCKGSLEWD